MRLSSYVKQTTGASIVNLMSQKATSDAIQAVQDNLDSAEMVMAFNGRHVEGKTLQDLLDWVSFYNNLRYADIRGLTISYVNFDNVDFSNAIISGCTFEFCSFNGAIMKDVQFRNCSIKNSAGLDGAKFDGAIISGSAFSNVAWFEHNYLEGAEIGASFTDLADTYFWLKDGTDQWISIHDPRYDVIAAAGTTTETTSETTTEPI